MSLTLIVDEQNAFEEVLPSTMQQRSLFDFVIQRNDAATRRLTRNWIKLIYQSIARCRVACDYSALRSQWIKLGSSLGEDFHSLSVSEWLEVFQQSRPIWFSIHIVHSEEFARLRHDHHHLVKAKIITHKSSTL